MTQIQVIEKDGKPSFYVIPAEIWDRVKDLVEDAQDALAYAESVANDDGTRIPHAVAQALMADVHPVRAWRDHRGLTAQALADAAGVSKPYISQIEAGKRAGTAATLKKIAGVLGVPLDLLTR